MCINSIHIFFMKVIKSIMKKLDRKEKPFHLHSNLGWYCIRFFSPICIVMIRLFQCFFLVFSIQHSSLVIFLPWESATEILYQLICLTNPFGWTLVCMGNSCSITDSYQKKNPSNPQITMLFAFSPLLTMVLD